MTAPKIMTVFGTRPEAIKVAPVIGLLNSSHKLLSITVSTGQHREMLEQVNRMFGIVPDFDLNIMAHGQGLNGLIGKAIERLDLVLSDTAPDAIIVQGDTSTAAAAAFAAFNRSVPVIHLEAGLRTGDKLSPFPEEGNRKLIGQLAELHLAPTSGARENLVQEGVSRDDICVTGNTVIDSLLTAAQWNTNFSIPELAALEVEQKRIVMVTTHRRENIRAMANIGNAVRRLSECFEDIVFVLPAHLNPEVRKAILPHLSGRRNVLVIDPLPYDQFTKLMSISDFVLTDSGGVQEEAPSLGKPVLVMRNDTERPEAVAAGTVQLVGVNEETIFANAVRLIQDRSVYRTMANAVNPYGDGRAAERTVAAIQQYFGLGSRMRDFTPA
ncbi:UDP-N-acetylglucosamine 2-epimerase (non-hydrolyzing) [Corynebacterium sp. P5848]|uniref:non-hydrolyzing UDP-N-acetylglucosamine 2-epimerase n=1 Tax=Corynebacterium marambiense TaxID=2765364 RepID=UPI002260FCFC|nr:UDP-N-acetylglucosamine 2-epimerase (non-hydrolyzing) [Corynebacterium marambiense]MCX7542895.1 UDP-N-acetylglucosamine 2-epimerase (non-hydrolyzing) [Corynebacterium marambiense]